MPGLPLELQNVYSAVVQDYAAYATPTDIVSLFGDGTKIIRVKQVIVSGIATGASTIIAGLIKRTTLNTVGTPTAATVVKHKASQPTSIATVNSYGAAPTVGSTTSGGLVDSRRVGLGIIATTTISPLATIFDFTKAGREIYLELATDALSLNMLGAALPGGTKLDIVFRWVEEPKP